MQYKKMIKLFSFFSENYSILDYTLNKFSSKLMDFIQIYKSIITKLIK